MDADRTRRPLQIQIRNGHRAIAPRLDRAIAALLRGDEILIAMIVREVSYKTFRHRNTAAGLRPVPAEVKARAVAEDYGRNRSAISTKLAAMVRQGILRKVAEDAYLLVKDYTTWLSDKGKPRLDTSKEKGRRLARTIADAERFDRTAPPDCWAEMAVKLDPEGVETVAEAVAIASDEDRYPLLAGLDDADNPCDPTPVSAPDLLANANSLVGERQQFCWRTPTDVVGKRQQFCWQTPTPPWNPL